MRDSKSHLNIRFWRTLVLLTLSALLPACGSGGGGGGVVTPNPSSIIPIPASVTVQQAGMSISVFALPPSGSSKPDSLVVLGDSVFVCYQDKLNPDGTIPGTTTQGMNEIVEYDLQGGIVRSFSVPGHNDGLMAFDAHTLWAMSNEDSKPSLTVIDLQTGTLKTYQPTVTPTVHGGGFDDMVLIGGSVYATCSNPTSNPNINPAVCKLTLNADGIHFDVVPVLLGNATATNLVAGGTSALNLQDPDSEAIAPNGDLVVDDQAESQLVFIHNPGASQTVSFLPLTFGSVPWQVDDVRYAPPGKSIMIFSDTKAGIVYRVDNAGFTPGTAYCAATEGQILSLNTATGALTPAITGLQAPHGMVFAKDPGAQPPVTILDNKYLVSVFATAPGSSTKPDSMVVIGNSIYVAYQDLLNPDGTIPPAGTVQGVNEICQYDFGGVLQKTWSVPGHNDGLLMFDANTLWAMSNEDAKPVLTVINLSAGTQKQYLPTVTPVHGGGFDDLVMIGGVVYVSCSNPTASTNTSNAVAKLTLNGDGIHFDVAPVLLGNALATNIVAGGPPAALNLQDPDSEAVAPNGDLVLDSQSDSELVFIHNPGSSQTVSVLPLTLFGNPYQVDDTRFSTSGNSFLLVADTAANVVYRIDALGGFTPGQAFSAGSGTVMTLNMTTGALNPILVGMNKPHGLLFVPH